MDYPIMNLLDDDACYEHLFSQLHPDGVACPDCGARDGLNLHRGHRAPIVDYRCGNCGRVFNIFTGTAFQGTRRRPKELVLILRGVSQGQSTAQLARELHVGRPRLLELRHRLQHHGLAAIEPEKLKGAPVVEADEMYQNAGEKRSETRRFRRSAQTSGQQRQRARNLGKRPASRAGRVRQEQR
jgi:transposase-like protein